VILPASRHIDCAWWRYAFAIDEEAVGVKTPAFVAALNAEGVRTSKEYPARPLFVHDMLAKQQTYGRSRFPFSASSCQLPTIEEFPGFQEYCERVIPIGWSSAIKERHVRSIAAAVGKIMGSLRNVASVCHQQKPELVPSGQ
jgi:dTDP-4-amino-4,6-dideoxygalactose transaminase